MIQIQKYEKMDGMDVDICTEKCLKDIESLLPDDKATRMIIHKHIKYYVWHEESNWTLDGIELFPNVEELYVFGSDGLCEIVEILSKINHKIKTIKLMSYLERLTTMDDDNVKKYCTDNNIKLGLYQGTDIICKTFNLYYSNK